MPSQMGNTNDGNQNKFQCIKKGPTTLLISSDGSNHSTDGFSADTSIIMVIVSAVVFANIGDPNSNGGLGPSTSSTNPTTMYLPAGTYFFAVEPGEIFRFHQEGSGATVTVVEGAPSGPSQV